MSKSDQSVRLESFLRKCTSSEVKVLSHDTITGGYSRVMSRVSVEIDGEPRGLVVRADPPAGTSIIETDRVEEWETMSAIAAAGTVSMPAPLWFDRSGEDLGSPAIITELIAGPSLLGRALQCDAGAHLTMAEGLCDLAAQVHRFDVSLLPPHVRRPESWDEYIDGRIQAWADTERRLPMRDPFMRYIGAWLHANKPRPAPLTLVHGDFQPNNVVIDEEGVYYMIDWELAHVGDPREDFGYMALCGINQPPDLIAAAPERFYRRYCQLTGMDEEIVSEPALQYFTVFGTASVYLPIIERLADMADGRSGSVPVAYTSIAVAGMHSVFAAAMDRHDGAVKGAG